MRKKDNQGFTLIEVIVSIAIGSIALGAILSVILTGFTTFGTFSTQKLKKDALDNIVDYVRDEIQNSSDVVISTIPPKINSDNNGDWSWIAVSNGKLYQGSYKYDKTKKTGSGTGKQALDDSYYAVKDTYDRNNDISKLSMHYVLQRRQKDNDNLSYVVNFRYVLKSDTETYKKNDAIEFSNVLKENGTTDKDYNTGDLRNTKTPQGNDKSPVSLNNSMQSASFNQDGDGLIRIYYNTKTKKESSETDPTTNPYLTGTVADKINEITPYLNRGYFIGTAESVWNDDFLQLPYLNNYRAGDFVYYKGYWYMCTKNLPYRAANYNHPDLGGSYWQRLTPDYDDKSTYYIGDVIRINEGGKNIYYRCIKDTSGYQKPDQYSQYWENIGDKPLPNYKGYDNTFSTMKDERIKDLLELNKDIKSSPGYEKSTHLTSFSYQGKEQKVSNAANYATDYPELQEYNSNTTYKIGDYVKVKVADSDGGRGSQYSYYEVYKKIAEPEAGATGEYQLPGKSFKSGWKLMENCYHPTSSYEKGDAVRLGTVQLDDNAVQGQYQDFIQLKDPKNLPAINLSSYGYYGYTYTADHASICNWDAKLYFGLRYQYFSDISISRINNSLTIDRYAYGDTMGRSNEFWLERAMIYYDENEAKNHNIDTDDKYTIGGLDNTAIRNAIWERKSYNDLIQEGEGA